MTAYIQELHNLNQATAHDQADVTDNFWNLLLLTALVAASVVGAILVL